MRVIVAILVLYGQVFAPWMCCCAASNVIGRLTHLDNLANTSTIAVAEEEPVCKECCHKVRTQPTAPTQSAPVNRMPCPIQSQLIESQPIPLIERNNDSIDQWLTIAFTFVAIEPVQPPRFTAADIARVDASPTLLTTELRLKYHHCLLC